MENQRVTVTNAYAGKKYQVIGYSLIGLAFLFLVLAMSAIGGDETAGAIGSVMVVFAVVSGIVGGIFALIGKTQHWYHAE